MTYTRTRLVSYEELEKRGNSAAVVIKLMIAFNDLQLANESLQDWCQDQPRRRRARQKGAQMYFTRLQMAHFFEALEIIKEIRKDDDLMRLVGTSDSHTRASFRVLEGYVTNPEKIQWLKAKVTAIRHNVVFHYHQGGGLITKAINDRASRPELSHGEVTRGWGDESSWNFEPGNQIIHSIVARQIWGIDRSQNLEEEAAKITDQIQDAILCFCNFAAELVWRYCGKN